MLNREKLLKNLHFAVSNLIQNQRASLIAAEHIWNLIAFDPLFQDFVKSKKWQNGSVWFDEMVGQIYPIDRLIDPYQIVAVDASQIYYDRHQGPGCFLINVAAAIFNYNQIKSEVHFFSEPSIFFSNKLSDLSDQTVNVQRDTIEHQFAMDQALQLQKATPDKSVFVLHDGLLMPSVVGLRQGADFDQTIVNLYEKIFKQYYEQKILHAGYVSFPTSQYLVNILKIGAIKHAVQFQDGAIHDSYIAQFFLKPFQRSIVFENKSILSYLLQPELRPYFCFMHVGSEIVRIEMPAWIALNIDYCNAICAAIIDQVIKGSGYPISLAHAHEQSVVRSQEKDFFYGLIKQFFDDHNAVYAQSKKSLKKIEGEFR